MVNIIVIIKMSQVKLDIKTYYNWAVYNYLSIFKWRVINKYKE